MTVTPVRLAGTDTAGRYPSATTTLEVWERRSWRKVLPANRTRSFVSGSVTHSTSSTWGMRSRKAAFKIAKSIEPERP